MPADDRTHRVAVRDRLGEDGDARLEQERNERSSGEHEDRLGGREPVDPVHEVEEVDPERAGEGEHHHQHRFRDGEAKLHRQHVERQHRDHCAHQQHLRA